MATFALSTLRNDASGGDAAATTDGSHYLLSRVADETLSDKASLKQILVDWPGTEASLQNLADKISNDPAAFSHAKADNASLDTPIRFPLCVGANYADHLREIGRPAKKWDPMSFFNVPATTTLVGPSRTVQYPVGTSQFDRECELVVVVGARLRNASSEEALAAIIGYTTGFDLSCRDWLKPRKVGGLIDLMRGRMQQTVKPVGPSFVPKKFVPFDQGLPVKQSVNGEPMMNGNTSDMIWRPEECLAETSKVVTIEPGDMIFTGTPAGQAESHGNRWLKVGDRISAEIGNLGVLDVEVTD